MTRGDGDEGRWAKPFGYRESGAVVAQLRLPLNVTALGDAMAALQTYYRQSLVLMPFTPEDTFARAAVA